MENVPTNLSNLKVKVEKLDIYKFAPALLDLRKLNYVIKKDVKKMYIILRSKIFKKICDITNLATTAALDAKINDVKNKIPSITNLATTTALTAEINEVKNKIPNISNLVEKIDYSTKIIKIQHKIPTDHDHDKYQQGQQINKLK